MRTLYTGVLLAICLCYLQVPSTHAASAYRLPAYTEYPGQFFYLCVRARVCVYVCVCVCVFSFLFYFSIFDSQF